MSTSRAPTGLLRPVIATVGLHSCLLGAAMLVAPLTFTRVIGFPEAGAAFFPSQAGIFLLTLGVCYLLALRDRAMTKVIVISKSFAVVFLVTHAVLPGGVPILWAAAAGDAGMLAVTVLALRKELEHGTAS